MQKHVIGFAIATAAFGAAAPAFAQFGQQGDVSFAADRLMGLYFIDDTFGDGFVAGIGSSPGGLPYTIGRLGIDFLVIDGLTLGGNAALWLADPEGPGESITGVLFHPRVGYAFAFSDSFGIWPRGGLTIWAVEDFSKFALTAEAMFFATPGDRWGFLFGPTFDAELAGDGGEGLVFGLMSAGIFGWF